MFYIYAYVYRLYIYGIHDVFIFGLYSVQKVVFIYIYIYICSIYCYICGVHIIIRYIEIFSDIYIYINTVR